MFWGNKATSNELVEFLPWIQEAWQRDPQLGEIMECTLKYMLMESLEIELKKDLELKS